jgi:hypothetical protein
MGLRKSPEPSTRDVDRRDVGVPTGLDNRSELWEFGDLIGGPHRGATRDTPAEGRDVKLWGTYKASSDQ